MWLCSVSHRGADTIGTADWNRADFRTAETLAHQALTGVGNGARERAFRMNITFCIHRALSDKEISHLPKRWNRDPGGLAGGPVEVLWSRGIEHREAAMPCHNPWLEIIIPMRPDLWLPVDCGKCQPCVERKMIRS